jgi:hypothetical protein
MLVQELGGRAASQGTAGNCRSHARPRTAAACTTAAEIQEAIDVPGRRPTAGTARTKFSCAAAAWSRGRPVCDVARVDTARTSRATAAGPRTGRRQVAHAGRVATRSTARPIRHRAAAGRSAHLRARGWSRHRRSPRCGATATSTVASSAATARSTTKTCTAPAATATASAATAAAKPTTPATAAGHDFCRHPGDCGEQAEKYENVAFHIAPDSKCSIDFEIYEKSERTIQPASER